MTSIKTIAAAALLTALTATPVFAQAAIGEPGAFAFYHPDLDVLNRGAAAPSRGSAFAPSAVNAYAATSVGSRHSQHPHAHHAVR
jgi:hypothetical protein